MILHNPKVFGASGGVTEILTILGVQKCQYLAKSEIEQIYILIINNEFLIAEDSYNSIFHNFDH